MNITQEKVDDLHAVLRVEVQQDDYMPKVEEAIRKYRKNVTMKGFRQGMVPVGLVKKMHGNAILMEELNKLVTERINEHLSEEKLDILGQPLPRPDNDLRLDINEPRDLVLEYDMGLVPEFDLSALGKDASVVRYKINLTDEQLEEEIDNLRLRHGNMTYPEDGVQERDILHVDITELDGDAPKEGGVAHSTTIGLMIFREEERKRFLGMKPGESVDVDLFAISDRERSAVAKNVLGLAEGEPEAMGSRFRIALTKIGRMEKTDLGEEFYGRVYGPGVIADEADFRSRLRNDIQKYFDQQAANRFHNDLSQYVLDHVNMELPADFLKRWIRLTNEKPVTAEQVEADYPNFERGLRWTLISNRIGRDHDIKAESDELHAHSRNELRKQLEMYNPAGTSISDEDLDNINRGMMSREDHVKKTYETVMEQKLFAWLEQAVTVEEKEVTLDEFNNLN